MTRRRRCRGRKRELRHAKRVGVCDLQKTVVVDLEALMALNELAPPPLGRHRALREWIAA